MIGFLIAFIIYATIDITYKKVARSTYDLERIVTKIKEKNPYATIGFQSIIISYSDSYRDKGGNWRTRTKEKGLYIRNGKLKKEHPFVFVRYSIVFLIAMLLFAIGIGSKADFQYLKLKDLKKVTKKIDITFALIMGIPLLFFLFGAFFEIYDLMTTSSDVTNKYLQVNTLDGYLK